MPKLVSGEPSTVWILGAGFSRALGAPLFRDLFRSDHLVKASGLANSKMLDALMGYRRHAPAELGGEGNGPLWQDPEEFLDVLESASSGNSAAVGLLGSSIGMSVAELADQGRRALAIECSYFLRGANVQTERWLPYRIWAESLTGNDTVVTFNYDRVPDLLGTHPGAMLEVIVPGADADMKVSEARARSAAPVLKLHGSVDWLAGTNGSIAVDTTENLPGTCRNGSDLLMAIPGPGKIGLRDRQKAIRFLWLEAMGAIGESKRVVFVGYRFPPTDAQARVQVLKTIKAASNAKTLMKVQVVLGPNENDPDVVRMKKVLSFVWPGKVDALPLYAEDFLAMPKEWTI